MVMTFLIHVNEQRRLLDRAPEPESCRAKSHVLQGHRSSGSRREWTLAAAVESGDPSPRFCAGQ
jgi:hypothetical protein